MNKDWIFLFIAHFFDQSNSFLCRHMSFSIFLLQDNKSGRTALHHAVEAHNPIVTRFLLLKDANVNAQTFSGNTPLHTANGCHMENIVNILLEFGADRKLPNFEGDFPIPETYLVC